MKKNIIHSTLAVSAIVLTAFTIQSCTDSKGNANTIPKSFEPIPVRVMSLEKSSGTQTITASGSITTDDETLLSFKMSGVVNSVLVKEGDRVKKGQLLATLDLREIDSHVAQARHGYEKAQRDYQRAERLYKDSVATLEQFENAATGLAIAKEQLEAASFNQKFSSIHATTNGYVLNKFVNPGQVVDVGDPVLMTNGASAGKWILKIGVSDKQWSVIQLKDKATVTIDAFPDKTFNAVVSRKWETSDPKTGAFTVELEVNHDQAKLASGMFGSAKFSSSKAEQSWSVPYEAVLDANDNEGFVFVTNDNKIAHKQAVTIESFDGKNIRINKGLENSSTLIISGSAYLSENSPITILK
jgi:RND family efflux transporter MFP subunit